MVLDAEHLEPCGRALVTSRTTSVPLPGLASPTAGAQVTVKLRGTTEVSTLFPDHHSRVTLATGGGTALATNDDDGTFDGRSIYVHDFAYDGSGAGLTNPAQITIESLTVPGAPPPGQYWSQMVPDWMEVRYRRVFQASSDVLTFDYPDGDAEFIVCGLTSGARRRSTS